MTNLEKEINKITLNDLVEWYADTENCACCIYAGEMCTGRDCKEGIRIYLEQEAEENEKTFN